MFTKYHFTGEITLDELRTMKEVVNRKHFIDIDQPLINFSFFDGILGRLLIITSELLENQCENDSLRLSLNYEGKVTEICRTGGNRIDGIPSPSHKVNRLIELVEYFSDVKIWDEHDRFNLETWMGIYDHIPENILLNRIET